MSVEGTEIAEAFSRHRFNETFAHMLDDIEWTLVGGDTVSGRAKVMEVCEASATELTSVRAAFERFRVLPTADGVVIDSQARYTDAEDAVSMVRSCDIYDFIDGKLAAITSFNIELSSVASV